MRMEACPPYWEKEETGRMKVGGMESVSGPKPSHCCCIIVLSLYFQGEKD